LGVTDLLIHQLDLKFQQTNQPNSPPNQPNQPTKQPTKLAQPMLQCVL
jgi:Rod binding domain-containing protein